MKNIFYYKNNNYIKFLLYKISIRENKNAK